MNKKTTADILAESFLEIAEQKNVNWITISDIVKNCGFSPATFYRHFRDKYDLIAWVYGKKSIEALGSTYTSINGWVSYCEENRKILLNLMENTSGYQSFIKSMIDIYVDYTENIIITNSGREALTDEIHRKVYLHVSGVILLINTWLKGKVNGTADEIAGTIHETFPESLRLLLTDTSKQK